MNGSNFRRMSSECPSCYTKYMGVLTVYMLGCCLGASEAFSYVAFSKHAWADNLQSFSVLLHTKQEKSFNHIWLLAGQELVEILACGTVKLDQVMLREVSHLKVYCLFQLQTSHYILNCTSKAYSSTRLS